MGSAVLTEREKAAARVRALRDGSNKVNSNFSWKDCFACWKDWEFPVWCIIAFTYPVAFATVSNFLPQIVQRLGYSVIKTNLWTVAPNAVGFVFLLLVAKSSDSFQERTFHVLVALITSLIGMIILITIDVLENKGVAYFACFLMAAGAYIPSCHVQTWRNNNDLNESSRAATTGLLVGLGNFAGILSAATFRVEFAPKYIPTLIATCCCNIIAIPSIAFLPAINPRLYAKHYTRRLRPACARLHPGDPPAFHIRRRLDFRRGMCSGSTTFAPFWAVAAVVLHQWMRAGSVETSVERIGLRWLKLWKCTVGFMKSDKEGYPQGI